MKENPESQPADDDAQDPLLAALRRQLGEGFGQEPPPALWAGVRQQLPAAPRPWWRSRRLLPLLAVLLCVSLLGGLAVRRAGLATSPAAAHQPAGERHQAAEATVASATAPPPGGPGGAPAPAAAPAGQAVASAPGPPLGPRVSATPTGMAHRGSPSLARSAGGGPPPALGAPAAASPPAQAAIASRKRRAAATGRARRDRPTAGCSARLALAARRWPEPAATAATQARMAAAARKPGSPAARNSSVWAAGRGASAEAESRSATAVARHRASQRVAAQPSAFPGAAAFAAIPGGNPALAALAGPPTTLDSLAGRPVGLLPPLAALPTALAVPPVPDRGWLPPARRWSVLVLAGPTLSYRTLGPANTSGLAAAPISTAPAGYTVGSLGNAASVERAALGWGAQAQARRVLSGRWALALGVGYQEYATWLSTPGRVVSTPSNAALPDTTYGLGHRDTYRFLTLPVQLGYTLGPPRGRLSLGLLGGLEPSWYRGGEASIPTGSVTQVQSFSSAAGSPYNAFNLVVSLGLDVRYRLGGPASRWQLVVQPTGRYLATPFVRGNSQGYTPRQPYSLGLLTGLAWELR